jgi:hypothetical protein
MVVKKNKLIIDYDYDFDLIGLISPLKEYRIAWLMNQGLKIHLVKNEDIELEFIDNNIFISNFNYSTGSSRLRLIRNKTIVGDNQMIYLLPEMKEFDYLIMISGEGDSFQSDDLVNFLKIMEGVQYVTMVDVSKLKSKENLIF